MPTKYHFQKMKIFCSKRCFDISQRGKKFTKEHKEKIRQSKWSEKNGMWKGDKVGKSALHLWMKNHKPKPEKCESCGKNPPKDLACKGHVYKRDIKCFEWLCRRCHIWSDGRIRMIHARKRKPLNCLECAKSFIPKENVQKFCSYRCAMEQRYLKMILCKWCKKEFKQKRRSSVFCSKTCANYQRWSTGSLQLIHLRMVSRKEKECTMCELVKPIGEFYWQTVGGKKYRTSRCKECSREKMRIYGSKRRHVANLSQG